MTDRAPDPLIERMRAADPESRAPVVTDAEIERALARVLATAHDTPRPAPRRAGRPRWLVGSGLAVAAAAIVVAIVVLGTGGGGGAGGGSGPALVTGRDARMVLDGATARLNIAPGSVLHTVVVGSATGGGSTGRVAHTMVDTWAQTSAPFDSRSLTVSDGRRFEIGDIRGRQQLFDPRRNTIYVGQAPPPYTVTRLGDGRYRLRVGDGRPATITAAQLRALRADRDTIISADGGPQVVPFSAIDHPPFDARTAALSILRSAPDRVRRTTFTGRAALEVTGTIGGSPIRMSYFIAPRTYTPLGIVQHVGAGATIVQRFTTFAVLHGTSGFVRRLVTLEGAHPGALINSSPAAWRAASNRLLP